MTMLRIHLMQDECSYSNPVMEEALYEIVPLRRFTGLSLAHGNVLDETTTLNFRRLLKTHALAPKVLTMISAYLSGKGLLLHQGTIVDAMIIHAAPSTRNKARERDPEMHQTRKGQQWYFDMKVHIDVDVEGGLVHMVTTLAVDVAEIGNLLHGKKKAVYADTAYTSAGKREGMAKRGHTWHIAVKRGRIKAMPEGELKDVTKHMKHMKAAVRSKVEHLLRVIKRQFGHQKMRFKGLAKNTTQILTLFALSNLWMARCTIMTNPGEVCP